MINEISFTDRDLVPYRSQHHLVVQDLLQHHLFDTVHQ